MYLRRGPIETYVLEFGHELTGPWPARRSITREVRDGLRDAAEAYHDSGASRVEAERRAIAECGPPAEAAEAFREELTAQQGRQTAWLLLAFSTLTFVAAGLVWRSAAPGDAEVEVSGAYTALAQAVDLLGAATLVVALMAIGAYGWAARWAGPVGRITSATGWTVLGISAAKIIGGSILWLASPTAMTSTAASLATVGLIVLSTAWLGWLATRCVALGSACRA